MQEEGAALLRGWNGVVGGAQLGDQRIQHLGSSPPRLPPGLASVPSSLSATSSFAETLWVWKRCQLHEVSHFGLQSQMGAPQSPQETQMDLASLLAIFHSRPSAGSGPGAALRC